ncbi:MAG TPA: tetratricopeptide repeat protein [Thermoanaerobaculia bacterium]|nr:tetratricopeptide repeat protein [Thermoanaerobaculia bacterium]
MSSDDDLESAFQTATAFRDAGDLHSAKELLERLAREHPDAFPVWLVLGSIEKKLENYEAAEKAFRTAVALDPRSELASVALFFALARQRRDDEAFDEARRFLTLRPDSKRYQEILDEIDQSLPA